MQEGTVEIFTDGASRGNPGDAAWAFILVAAGGVVEERSAYLGKTTNNVAEYHAVIHALEEALVRGWRHARVYSDSELVVRQIRGEYQVRKSHLVPLWSTVRSLSGRFEAIEFCSVRRDHPRIQRADQLCNATLDRERGKTKGF